MIGRGKITNKYTKVEPHAIIGVLCVHYYIIINGFSVIEVDNIDYAEYCIGDSYKYDTSNMKTVKLEQNSVDSIRNKIMFLSLLRGWLYTIYINDVI